MKKYIFLCLILIICIVNTFTIHEAKAREKIRELFRDEFPRVKKPASVVEKIVIRYFSKMTPIYPKKFTIS